MDSQCDYLVLDIPKGPKDDDDDDDVDCEVCKEPIRQGFYEWKGGAICVSLDQATAGAMVPYVDAGISEHASGEAVAKSSTVVWYVADSTVVELKGDTQRHLVVIARGMLAFDSTATGRVFGMHRSARA